MPQVDAVRDQANEDEWPTRQQAQLPASGVPGCKRPREDSGSDIRRELVAHCDDRESLGCRAGAEVREPPPRVAVPSRRSIAHSHRAGGKYGEKEQGPEPLANRGGTGWPAIPAPYPV